MKKENKNRTRKIEFKLRLSEDEARILDSKWKVSGLKSRNAFLRRLIVYGFVFDIDYSDLRESNAELARIGNNLNQIAHIANACGQIDNKNLQKAKELMEKIWQLQKSTLSKQPLINQ